MASDSTKYFIEIDGKTKAYKFPKGHEKEALFLEKYPNAVTGVRYTDGIKNWTIPPSKKDALLSKFPNAKLVDDPIDKPVNYTNQSLEQTNQNLQTEINSTQNPLQKPSFINEYKQPEFRAMPEGTQITSFDFPSDRGVVDKISTGIKDLMYGEGSEAWDRRNKGQTAVLLSMQESLQQSEGFKNWSNETGSKDPLRYVNENFSKVIRDPQITGIQGDPTTMEMLEVGMGAGVATSLGMAGIIPTTLGVASFAAIDEATSYAISKINDDPYVFGGRLSGEGQDISDLLPEEASESLKETMQVFDLLAKGALLWKVGPKAKEAITRKGKQFWEAATKEVIVENNMTRRLYLDPMKVRSILGQRDGKFSSREMELYQEIRPDLTKDQIMKSLKKGIEIEVPAEKIARIYDKPWWGKIKSAFGIKKSAPVEVSRTRAGVDKAKVPPLQGQVRGLLKPPVDAKPVAVPSVKPGGKTDYMISHRPSETGPPAHDMFADIEGDGPMSPSDLFKNPEYYIGTADRKSAVFLETQEQMKYIEGIQGEPEADITVYRSSPKNELNDGDWVSLSKDYAKISGQHPTDEAKDMPVFEHKIKVKDLKWDGNSLEEWGYYPEKLGKPEVTEQKLTDGTPIKTSVQENVALDDYIQGQESLQTNPEQAGFTFNEKNNLVITDKKEFLLELDNMLDVNKDAISDSQDDPALIDDLKFYEKNQNAILSLQNKINELKTEQDPTLQVDVEKPKIEEPKPKKNIEDVKFKDKPPGELPEPKTKIIVAPGSGAEKVQNMHEETDAEFKDKKRITVKNIKAKLVRGFTDRSGNVKKELMEKGGEEGKEAVMNHELIKGAPSNTGRIIGEAEKSIYKDLNKDEIKLFDRIINSRTTIAVSERDPNVKNPRGLTKKEHQEWLDNLPEEVQKKLFPLVDKWFDVGKQQLKEMKDEGLLDDDLYNKLKLIDYSPREFIQYIDPDMPSYETGGKVSISSSGIKKLDRGSEEVLNNNSTQLLGQIVSRAQSRIFRNRANKSLLRMVEQNPDIGIAKLAPGPDATPPTGFEAIDVMIDGKKKRMFMPNEFAKEWSPSTDLKLTQSQATITGIITGSSILKPFATGALAPAFAPFNFIRDVSYVYLNESAYSDIGPIALKQMGQDIAEILPDAIGKKGRYIDYIKEGGGMDFLSKQGGTVGMGTKLGKAIGFTNELSEVVMRLAVRNRLIKQGMSPVEASWRARRYLDFNVGGSVSKTIDNIGFPYLNAAIQGTRGTFNTLRGKGSAGQSKAKAWNKMAQIMSLAVAGWYANQINKDTYDEISPIEKSRNWIFTTGGHKYVDKDGFDRHFYYRIPKDQGQSFFTTMIEASLEKMHYGKNIYENKGVWEAVNSIFGMINPKNNLPPILNALIAYNVNYDLFYEDRIWKGNESVEQYAQYNDNTHPFFRELAKKAKETKVPMIAEEGINISPIKLQRSLQKYIPANNVYASAVGYGTRLLMNELPEKEQLEYTKQTLAKYPFINKFLRTTSPYKKDPVAEKIKREVITASTLRNRKLNKYIVDFYRKLDKNNKDVPDVPDEYIKLVREEVGLKEGKDFMPNADNKFEYWINRFILQNQVKNLPSDTKKFWTQFLKMGTPQQKAMYYAQKYNNLSKSDQKKYEEILQTLTSVYTEQFISFLEKYKEDFKEK